MFLLVCTTFTVNVANFVVLFHKPRLLVLNAVHVLLDKAEK